MIPMNAESRLQFRKYSCREERGNYIIEVADTAEFYELEAPGVEAIERLAGGGTIDEVQRALEQRYPDEDIEISAFVLQLIEMGLVASVDDFSLDEPQQAGSVPRGFTRIPQWLGRLFYQPAALMGYGVVLLANVTHFIRNPGDLPRPGDLFPYEIMFTNMATWLSLSIVVLLIHEAGHVLALRAYGLPARWQISNRLFFVVMETEMQAIWRLPARSRNVPYLGGMCMDQLVLFAALLGLEFIDPAHHILYGLLKIAVFQIMMMTAFQFMLFMKTDMYYVLENITGCYNLMERAKLWIRVKISRRREDAAVSGKEKRVIGAYALIYMIGMGGMGGLLAFYFIPQLLHMIKHAILHLSMGAAHFSMGMFHWRVLDSLFILLLVAGQFGLLIYLWVRNWQERAKS